MACARGGSSAISAQVGLRVEQHVRLELRGQQRQPLVAGHALGTFGRGLCAGQPAARIEEPGGRDAGHQRQPAADGVAPQHRARALSLVMAGGVAAGVVGPQLVTR
ncbi:MAG TPA: hypothetical protein PKB14_25840, partial [Rubrivivax sp.]|nr:hypothetical protein [Rubrivivax sp.]